MSRERTPELVVVEALGTAWTVHSLYPDPEAQPAFRRAVESLRQAITPGLMIAVEGAQFFSGGEPIEVEREGAERLARRCFVHHVESVRFEEPPSEVELARLFSTLSRDEGSVRAAGGVSSALRRDGVATISVVQRALLKTAPVEEVIERHADVVRVIEMAEDPIALADSLTERAGGDPDTLARLFHDEYRMILGKLADDDYQGREEVVRAFVEAFFHLDDDGSLAVFSIFLETQEGIEERAFLDQFAAHELARVAPKLDTQALALLLDYARVSTDQADGRPEELLELLKAPDAVQSAREVAAVSVAERLRDVAASDTAATGGFLDSLRGQFPDAIHFFYNALEVFRGLLAVEVRDDRFRRLMRIWVGKVGTAVRRGQYRRAELWLRAVTDHATYPEERQPEIDDALGQLASSEIMSLIVDKATEGGDSDHAVSLLEALGSKAVNILIDLLAEEQDAGRRRTLVDILAHSARADATALTARLSDSRWYLVRNLVVVLRLTGDRSAIRAMRPVLSYGDHRVRLEALRALAVLGDEALPFFESALSDDQHSVRQTAIGLLGAQPSPDAERLLAAALERRNLDLSEKQRIVEILGDRDGTFARSALEELARRRFSLSSNVRILRRLALGALEERPT